jgi:Tol biopolymer transport system component
MPGSHTIYFNTLVIAGEAGYRIPQVDLYSVNADGDGDAITTQESPGSGGVPYFSPDGTIVALAQPDKIIFMEVTGAYWNVALTFPKILTYSEWMYVPEVVWLPDSSGVWVVIPASDPLSDPTQPSTFWNVPISGSPSVQTTFVAVPAFASAPVISPDGSKVLYLGESGGEDNLQVLQVDGLDTGYTFAESGQVGIVNWSPDSTHFVYWLPQPATTYIAAVGEIAYNVSDTSPIAIAAQWIDDNRVIYIGDSGELRYRTVDGISSLIDAGVNEYNFAFWVH